MARDEKAGVEMSKRTPENIVYAMHEYYRAGHSIRQTAKEFQVSKQTVRNGFVRHNLPIRSRVHGLIVRHNIRAEVLEMFTEYRAGKSSGEIGRMYHLSGGAVRKRFRSYGLVPGRTA